MIKIENLYKVYENRTALNNLNLHINEGELFGLIGPNGAGKTTLIKILCGLIKPTSGNVFIGGFDLNHETEIKKIIGYLPEGPHLYEDMIVKDYLNFFSEIYDRKTKTDFKILDSLGIGDRKESRISTLSKGTKRKIEIARALINDPKILIFDEPTSGLDPITSRFIRDFMKELSKQGKTVFMATHYLHEAENLCHRVGILNEGKLIETGKIDDLRNKFKTHDLEDIFIRAISQT